MISANDLTDAFARNVNIVKMQTKDLTHEDSLRQPPFRGNCLNWVLGHIAENRDHILELLGEQPKMGTLGARYKRGSEPLTDASDGVLRLDELLTWLDRAQERLAAAIARMDDTAWAREVTVGNNRKTTVGQRVFFLYFHETYHVGQTELFRQLAGKDDNERFTHNLSQLSSCHTQHARALARRGRHAARHHFLHTPPSPVPPFSPA